MKRILTGILGITAILSFSSLQAQTADEIVNKYIDAMGGKDKIAQMKSIYIESSMQVMGNDNPSTTSIINGVGYKNEAEFNGAKIIQCYTDKGGWSINPMGGSSSAEAMPDEMYKAGKDQIDIAGGLFNYAAKGATIELQGKEGNNFKIKLVSKDKVETTYFIDGNSWLASKIVKKGSMMGQDVEISVKTSDYKKTDFGYTLPFTTEFDFGGQFSMTMTIKKVEVNKTLDPAIFAMPK